MTEPVAQYLEVKLEDVAATPEGILEGLAIPFDTVLNRVHALTGATRQKFAKGSIKTRPDSKLYYGHDHREGGMPIGRVLSAADDGDKGSRQRVRFAKTVKAAEVLELTTPDEDGVAVLDRFSIGYFDSIWHLEEDGDLLVHDEVDQFELSIVPLAGYHGEAVIDTVLSHQHDTPPAQHKEPAMPDTLDAPVDISTLASAEDVQTLSESITALERQVVTLGEAGAPGEGAPAHVLAFESYGEYVHALAKGDPDAKALYLDFTGSKIADQGDWVKASWIGDIIRYQQENRRVLNLFQTQALPAQGMNVEYGKLGPDTTQVAEQLVEGDELVYGKINFTTATAPVKTYGGWGDMSRQAIERSPIGIVEKFFEALVRRYNKVSEGVTRTKVTGAVATGGHAVAGTDLSDSDGWISFVTEAALYLDDQGVQPEFILCGRDVWRELVLLRDGVANDAPRLLDRTNGNVNIVGLTGSLFNLPVYPLGANVAADFVTVGNKAALKTLEAPGAPFRLQDEDITNLTKAFSIYGYIAWAQQESSLFVKPGV